MKGRHENARHDATPGLEDRVSDLGFTPKLRDLPELLGIVGGDDEKLARAASRAISRIDAQHRERVVAAIVAHLANAVRPARGRLTRLLGELLVARSEEGDLGSDGSSRSEARAWLTKAIADDDPKTRRAAARAIGKIVTARTVPEAERASVEAALLDAWKRTDDDDDRRALAEALGKIGSKEARELFGASDAGARSPKLDARTARARVMIDRAEAREDLATIDASRAPSKPIALRFRTRAGLEGLVADEIAGVFRAHVAGPGVVDTKLARPLHEAVRVRTALHVAFPMAPIARSEDLAEDIAAAVTSPEALDVFRAFTRTTKAIRFRLAFADGKRRTSVAWRVAERVRARTSALVNDPTASTWEVVVDVAGGRTLVELVPRGLDDDRFDYRRAVVPASSHPVLAAAIARLAPRSEGDVVWDPFVGAGAELVERARLGPYAALHGTDRDPKALEAARTNLQYAHIERVTLTLDDALDFAPPAVNVIVTNPPMGRRVHRGSHADLLERFVGHAFRALAPGGALVWAVPEARKIHALAEREGFSIERATAVDMGGFPADLSVYRKPTRPPARAAGPRHGKARA